MKPWTFAAAAAALMLAACSQPAATKGPAAPPEAVTVDAPAGEYTLDKNHSTVTVRAMHFGLAHYTLRFDRVEGALTFDPAHPAQSSVTASVPIASLSTTYSGDRDFNAELQNSEWLNAASFPVATFRSTSVELTGGNTGRMTGDLTIRGQTHPATFDVTFNRAYRQHPMGAPFAELGFSAHGVIKRSDYGLRVLQPAAGSDAGVSDDVEIIIEAEFQQPIAPQNTNGTPAPRATSGHQLMSTTTQRYSAVAIVLHWAIAVSILYMIPLGFWMGEQVEHGQAGEGVFRAFQLHKSIGLTILLLSLIRLGWRLTHRPPPLPAHMPAWEKFAALATHWLFYVFIIAMPLSGWLYVSTQWSAPTDQPLPVATHFFGWFRVPGLFGLAQADETTRKGLSHLFLTWHWAMAWAAVALVGLHVAAALKHEFVDRDETVSHMIPGWKAPNQTEAPPRSPGRNAVLGVGLSLVAVAAIAMLYAASGFVSSPQAAPPQTASTFETTTAAPTTTEAPATTTTATTTTTTAPAAAAPWRVNAASSSIGFSFVYNDEENGPATFNGRFSRWRADIRFDPNDLEHSVANVTIETASASDGVPIHDQYLPTAEWFNSGANPAATFRTTSIARRGQGYVAQGTLTIKGHARPVSLPFTLTINGAHASMNGHLTINRRDFGVGNGSDGDDTISNPINLTIRVEAERGS